jgi:hypothetical protein
MNTLHVNAIGALRKLGQEINFVPALPHSLFAYTREDLISCHYETFGGSYHIIQDAAEFCHPHYIFDGLALKIEGRWMFGCPMQFIK